MTNEEFAQVSEELRSIAPCVPGWGRVQNNGYDDLINMYGCPTLEDLERALEPFDEHIKSYWLRRWFAWRLSDCDEHLFCENYGVVHNPNHRDKSWDIDIRGAIRFDIKGTRVPYAMSDQFDYLLKDPSPMIRFFYDYQSRERRYGMQNRLFVVHHPLDRGDQVAENLLRCEWGVKREAYRDFCESLDDVKMVKYQDCLAAVIYIFGNPGSAEYYIPRLISDR